MQEIVIAIIGSGLLTTLLNHWLNARSKKKEKDDGLRAGVRLLLLDSIKSSGQQYIQDGNITHAELSEFIEKYNTYKQLGGDGFADAVKEKVSALPLIEM